MNIGIDLIAIARFRKIKESDYQRWSRVFSAREWQYAFQGKRAAERLAGMFAAKEAAMKAYRTAGITGFGKFEVRHTSSGLPYLHQRKASLSISHNAHTAVAVVVTQK